MLEKEMKASVKKSLIEEVIGLFNKGVDFTKNTLYKVDNAFTQTLFGLCSKYTYECKKLEQLYKLNSYFAIYSSTVEYLPIEVSDGHVIIVVVDLYSKEYHIGLFESPKHFFKVITDAQGSDKVIILGRVFDVVPLNTNFDPTDKIKEHFRNLFPELGIYDNYLAAAINEYRFDKIVHARVLETVNLGNVKPSTEHDKLSEFVEGLRNSHELRTKTEQLDAATMEKFMKSAHEAFEQNNNVNEVLFKLIIEASANSEIVFNNNFIVDALVKTGTKLYIRNKADFVKHDELANTLNVNCGESCLGYVPLENGYVLVIEHTGKSHPSDYIFTFTKLNNLFNITAIKNEESDTYWLFKEMDYGLTSEFNTTTFKSKASIERFAKSRYPRYKNHIDNVLEAIEANLKELAEKTKPQ